MLTKTKIGVLEQFGLNWRWGCSCQIWSQKRKSSHSRWFFIFLYYW